MKPKPTPKREMAIASYSEETRMIVVHGTNDAVSELAPFGTVILAGSLILFVDARFDFNEVLEWIEAYG